MDSQTVVAWCCVIITIIQIIISIFYVKPYRGQLFDKYHSDLPSYIVLFNKKYTKEILFLLITAMVVLGVFLFFEVYDLIVSRKNVVNWGLVVLVAGMPPLLLRLGFVIYKYRKNVTKIQTAEAIKMAHSVKVKDGTRKAFPHIENNDDLVFEMMCLYDSIIKKEAPYGNDQRLVLEKEKEILINKLRARRETEMANIDKIDKQLGVLLELFKDEYFIRV